MRKIIFLLCFSSTLLRAQTSGISLQTVSNYKGWKWDTTIVMANDLITMATVPAIGGRVMQYDLGSLPSVMVNSSLFGKKYTPANNGTWYNFGGYKTWPSPQSAWNWPPPPTLDYGAYTVPETSLTNDSVALTILSPIEKWLAPNIQFKRRATIFAGTSRVRMEQTMINTGTSTVSWGMWSIMQTIVNHTGKSDYTNYWAYFPINPNSVYGASGVSPELPTTAWKGEVAPGVYGVQFVADNKKIYADPGKGWIAYADLSDTVVFGRTFPIFEGMQYPDNGARVTVYVSSGSAPLYMEVEVKGPVIALAAGGNYTFTENWWAAKVRAPILDMDSVGAIANRLSYNSTTQSFSGIYGVFYKGTAKVVFVDALNRTLTEGQSHTVSPLAEFQLQEAVGIPNGAKTAKVQIYNTKSEFIGVLESLDVSGLPTAIVTTTPVIVTEYSLAQNYPNPFNPSTTIKYYLPQAAHVDLSIYDVQGQCIQKLVDAYQTGGTYSVRWNGQVKGRAAASGVYFAMLTTVGKQGAQSHVQRMVLLK